MIDPIDSLNYVPIKEYESLLLDYADIKNDLEALLNMGILDFLIYRFTRYVDSIQNK